MKAGRTYSRRARPLDSIIERITKPVRKKRGFAEARVINEWDSIVGSALAQYSIPQKLSFPKGAQSGATLYLLCDATWALELQHYEPMIKDRLATFFGYKAVDRIVIKQGVVKHQAKEDTAREMMPIAPNANDLALEEALQRLTQARTQALAKSEGMSDMKRNNAKQEMD